MGKHRHRLHSLSTHEKRNFPFQDDLLANNTRRYQTLSLNFCLPRTLASDDAQHAHADQMIVLGALEHLAPKMARSTSGFFSQSLDVQCSEHKKLTTDGQTP